MAHRLVFLASLLLVLLLAFLTIGVLVQEGIDALVVISLVLLAVLGFGVLGALTSPPDE